MSSASQPSLSIVADDRECHSSLFAELDARSGFDLRVQRLAVGDYRLDGRFLIERKTLPDLAASIKSGRLFAQALRLTEVDSLRPMLLLEGTARDLQDCGMRREAFQGALVTVSVFIGLPILRTWSACRVGGHIVVRCAPGSQRGDRGLATAGPAAEKQAGAAVASATGPARCRPKAGCVLA